jgi:hypothetical protein
MKRVSPLRVLFVFCCSLPLTGAAAGEAPAKVCIPSEQIDIGDIYHAEAREVSFGVRNCGVNPLRMAVKSVSCGCTHGAVDSAPVEAGTTRQVVVGFKPDPAKPRFGRQVFQVVLETNDPEQPLLGLSVAANLLPAAVLQPEKLLLPAGAGAQFQLKLRSEEAVETPTVDSPDWVAVKLEATTVDGPWTLYTWSVTTLRPPPLGSGETSLTIKTGTGDQPVLELPLEMPVQELIASPPALLFSSIEAGVSKSLVLTLQPRGHRVPVRAISSSAHLQVVLEQAAGEEGAITATATLQAPTVEAVTLLREEVQFVDAGGHELGVVSARAVIRPNAR